MDVNRERKWQRFRYQPESPNHNERGRDNWSTQFYSAPKMLTPVAGLRTQHPKQEAGYG